MMIGKVVKVRLYGGDIVDRRVIGTRPHGIVICTESEYQAAKREGREPSGLVFPRQDVFEPQDEGQLTR